MTRLIRLHMDEGASATEFANAGSAGGTWDPSMFPPTSGVAGVRGEAIDLVGDGQWRNVSGNPSVEPVTFTAWCWVYLRGYSISTADRLLHKDYFLSGVWSSPNLAVGLSLNAIGHPLAYLTQGGVQHVLTGASPLSLNVWHMVAETFDGQTLTGYLDGVAFGSVSLPGVPDYGTHGNWRAGSTAGNNGTNPNPGFNGLLDELNVDDEAFTAARVFAEFGARSKLFVLSAVATSTREVRVSLSDAPASQSASAPGQGTNPLTWQVVRLDTGFLFSTVIATLVDLYDVLIYSLEEFGPASVSHVVAGVGLLAAAGDQAVSPTAATFAGTAAAQPNNVVQLRASAASDLANAATGVGGQVGGTFRLDSSGDFAVEQDLEKNVRKMVFRVLFTRPGEFTHLPGFGAGLAEKELVLNPIAARQAAAERAVKTLAGIRDAAVSFEADPVGILFVRVVVALDPAAGGGAKSFSFDLPPQTVGFSGA
jgi:hypothetical protein